MSIRSSNSGRKHVHTSFDSQPQVDGLRRRFRVKTLAELSQQAIDRANKLTQGDYGLAATLLGVSRTTVYRYFSMSGQTKKRAQRRRRGQSKSMKERQARRIKREFGIKTLHELERNEVDRVLGLNGDNIALTARLLGITKTTLYRKTKPMRKPKKRQPRIAWAERKRAIPSLRRKLGIKNIREMRHDMIARVLKLTNGDVSLTAALLGMGKTTIYRVLRTSK